MGGMALHEGRISEMRTGEGKTLVATLPVYLNALAGRGVHVVTVNDYLAQRDAAWMAPVYQALGLSVGVVRSGQEGAEKRAAYLADITYGTNNEFGFDYLRDNMAFTAEDKVQRDRFFALIDEVDSILIDEARTPLIISGPAEDSSALYRQIDQPVRPLTPRAPGAGQEPETEEPGDFAIDEKNRQIELLEEGHEKLEEAMKTAGLLPPEDSCGINITDGFDCLEVRPAPERKLAAQRRTHLTRRLAHVAMRRIELSGTPENEDNQLADGPADTAA